MTAMNMESYKNAIKEGKPFLAEFSAPWCSFCRKIGPALERVEKQYADRVLFGQIDVDDNPDVAHLEQVEVIPTLIFFKDGKAVGSVVAPDSKARIEAFIDECLAK